MSGRIIHGARDIDLIFGHESSAEQECASSLWPSRQSMRYPMTIVRGPLAMRSCPACTNGGIAGLGEKPVDF